MAGLRCLPHGPYTLFPAVFCTIAWLAALSQDGCDYSTVTGTAVSGITGSQNIPYVQIGFSGYRQPVYNDESDSWSMVYSEKCQRWGPELQDSWWSASKAFDFGALVLGGASAFFLWFSTCFVFSRGTWRCTAYQVFLAFICQCISFVFFRTSMCTSEGTSCKLFYGSQADICSAALWFISACMVFCRYPRPTPKFEQRIQVASEELTEELEETSSAALDVSVTVPLHGDSAARIPMPTDLQSNRDDERLSGVEIV